MDSGTREGIGPGRESRTGASGRVGECEEGRVDGPDLPLDVVPVGDLIPTLDQGPVDRPADRGLRNVVPRQP